MDALTANPLPDLEPGSVWLIGAGPGDPGLVTLLAAKALRQADFILYDPAIPGALRRLFGAGATVEAMPRRNDGDGPAAFGADRAIALAQAGRRVARLVEGDPLGTAHGVAEAQEIAAAGVPLRIVPGIGTALAGGAYAGIPATHRDVNSLFATLDLTGGGAPPASVEIAALAKAVPVLFITLTADAAGAVAAQLIAAGKPAATPVALIEDPGRAGQATHVTTLGESAATARNLPGRARIVMISGPVVTLRRQLQSRQPAFDHQLGFSMCGIAG